MATTASIALNLPTLLPEASRDDTLLKDAFKDGILLPYSGTGAAANFGMAKLLHQLTELSGSRGACIGDILAYAFDQGALEIIGRNASGFSVRENLDVSDSDANAYIDALWSIGIDANTLRQNAKDIYSSYRTTGFAALLCELTRVGGETRLKFIAGTLEHVVLGRNRLKIPGGKFDATQQQFNREGLTAYYFPNGLQNLKDSVEHYAFPVYDSSSPDLVALATAQGFNRFALILRNGKGPYGRPIDMSALRYMITEAAYAVHDEQVASVITTARSIVTYPLPEETEDSVETPEYDQDGNEIVKRKSLEERAKDHSNEVRKKLDGNDIAFLGYKGDKSPTLLNITINRDSAYRKTIDEIAQAKIYAANRWSTDMSGASNPSAGIGSEAFSSQVALRNRTVINSAQQMIATLQNEALLIALPQPQFENLIHSFPDPLAGMDALSGQNEGDGTA